MRNKKIIVTGGGTGGHLMPAIAICEKLRAKGANVILVTDARCKDYLPSNLPFKYYIIDAQRFRNISKIFHTIYSWVKALFDSVNLMQKEKAVAVIGCGGYSSMPLILTAFCMRKKIILHEQNAYVGRANYIFAYLSDLLFLSFMHTVNIPLIDNKKIVWSGIPLTQKHKNNISIKKPVLSKKLITILITGGSQGASIFDEVIFDAIKLLKSKLQGKEIKVIQQVRSSICSDLKNAYSEINIECDVANFYHNMENHYLEADIYIGRAGASSVNEIINYKIPAIFVPYPFAQNNHQYYNAMNLAEFKAALLLKQKDMTPDSLANKLLEIIENPEFANKMTSKLHEMQIDSSEIITNEIHKIIDK